MFVQVQVFLAIDSQKTIESEAEKLMLNTSHHRNLHPVESQALPSTPSQLEQGIGRRAPPSERRPWTHRCKAAQLHVMMVYSINHQKLGLSLNVSLSPTSIQWAISP